MNRKLKILFELINNVGEKYLETKDYIEENMKKICESKDVFV